MVRPRVVGDRVQDYGICRAGDGALLAFHQGAAGDLQYAGKLSGRIIARARHNPMARESDRTCGGGDQAGWGCCVRHQICELGPRAISWIQDKRRDTECTRFSTVAGVIGLGLWRRSFLSVGKRTTDRANDHR